jgi:hypothetical protein
MMQRADADPLVGDELLEITLEAHYVRFTFMKSVLQIGAPFVVSFSEESATRIDPKMKSGDLTSVWLLIGKVVKTVVWNETVTIVFDGKVKICIGPSPGRIRGTIMGRRDMTVEDF